METFLIYDIQQYLDFHFFLLIVLNYSHISNFINVDKFCPNLSFIQSHPIFHNAQYPQFDTVITYSLGQILLFPTPGNAAVLLDHLLVSGVAVLDQRKGSPAAKEHLFPTQG